MELPYLLSACAVRERAAVRVNRAEPSAFAAVHKAKRPEALGGLRIDPRGARPSSPSPSTARCWQPRMAKCKSRRLVGPRPRNYHRGGQAIER